MNDKFVADFETLNDTSQTRVWEWGACQIGTENFFYGKTIDEFMNVLLSFDATWYFHNLKFDGEFIFCWLFEHGYKHTEAKKGKGVSGEFGTLISGEGQFYNMWIKSGDVTVTIIDSLKIINMPVKKIGEAYKLGETKGEIDYNKFRPEGYEPTPEEIDYLRRDVLIVARALKMLFDEGLSKNTQASNAMFGYKKMIGDNFKKWYPELDIAVYDEIRHSYKGGWCYLNPKYKGKIVGKGHVFDKNSMYPWVMKTKVLPFGEPVHYVGKYEYDKRFPLWIGIIRFHFTLKENYVPTIQIKEPGPWGPTEYLTDNNGEDVCLCMTCIDWELIQEHYDVYNVEYIEGWKFRGQQGMFDEYINKWYGEKEKASREGNAGKKQAAKIMQNALYGKFGKSPYMTDKIPYYDNGRIRYRTTKPRQEDGIYVPVASFITAYARQSVIKAAQDNYENFAYSDTDSVHLIGEEVVGLDVDNYRLGAWKEESVFSAAKFLRQKTYMEVINGKYEVKCAGLPENCRVNLTFDDFYIGATFWGKLRPRHVKGGIVLEEGPFQIRP